jgi:hypothetical protein
MKVGQASACLLSTFSRAAKVKTGQAEAYPTGAITCAAANT